MTSEEDKAWHLIDRTYTLNRKRQIENQMRDLTDEMNQIKYVTLEDFNEPAKTAQEFYEELRNGVIEEVAQHIERLTGFGKDTVDSLTTYVRDLKK
jgi:hypothetical protein